MTLGAIFLLFIIDFTVLKYVSPTEAPVVTLLTLILLGVVEVAPNIILF